MIAASEVSSNALQLTWTPNTGNMPVDPECEVVLRFANGQTSMTTTAGQWHWGMHRIMPGTIVAWTFA